MNAEVDNTVRVFELKRGSIEVKVTNYGATIMSIVVPDANGHKANVVAGFSDPQEYLGLHPYFGTTIGRFANRIAGGRFQLDGQEVQLTLNEKINQLHGGFHGFDKKTWEVLDHNDIGISFSYTSPDGEEGFPGKLETTVRYTLIDDNSLRVSYTAITDKPTVISLTNHSYFNLSGFESDTIHDHHLQVNARGYTLKNANNTSTGETAPVTDTALDFTSRKRLGDRIHELVTDMGYDHNYVLDPSMGVAAILDDPSSGRSLEVITDRPGMQLYSSNWWDGTIKGAQGKFYQKHGAVALETQAFPDAPNHPGFPSATLRPGETWQTMTIFKFTAR